MIIICYNNIIIKNRSAEDHKTEKEENEMNEMKNRIWYAVQESSEDSWDYGSDDYETAKDMLLRQGHGQIAVIDTKTNFCLNEFYYEEF